MPSSNPRAAYWAAISFWHLGQYQGAGVLTGFGLLLRHLAQRKRLPLIAVFGRTFFPVLKTFAIVTPSLPGQHDLDPVSGRGCKELVDVFPHWRSWCRCPHCDGMADFEKHFLQSCWSNRNQHLRRPVRFVLESVHGSNWHIGKSPGAGDKLLAANEKGDLTFEHMEAFLLSTVDVRGWAASRKNNGFQLGIHPVGVLSCCQESVHVANDGDGPAFAGPLDKEWRPRVHGLPPGLPAFSIMIR
jgi:hypothetical protein